MKETWYVGLFDIKTAFVHSPTDEFIALTPPAGIVQPGQGTLVETCTARNAQSVEALGENLLKGLEQRRMD